jgi:hypothetical protein
MSAMGGAATLAVNESLRILRYTDGLPKDMLHLLEKETLALPLASLVALGIRGTDALSHPAGTYKMERWCVKNVELEAILMVETVDFVAFGSSTKSFVTKSPAGMKWSCIPRNWKRFSRRSDQSIVSAWVLMVNILWPGRMAHVQEDGGDGSKIDQALDRLKEGGLAYPRHEVRS